MEQEMREKTLGEVLKSRRRTLRLTQREIAVQLGDRPSHIAYLENDQRRPSLALVRRIAEVWSLDKETLFLLAHPEARSLMNQRAPALPSDLDGVWRDFVKDEALLVRYHETPGAQSPFTN